MSAARARGLCLMISLCACTGQRQAAEGYLLELLAWLADRVVVAS